MLADGEPWPGKQSHKENDQDEVLEEVSLVRVTAAYTNGYRMMGRRKPGCRTALQR